MRASPDAYAAFVARLEASPAPNPQLRRTMQTPAPWDGSAGPSHDAARAHPDYAGTCAGGRPDAFDSGEPNLDDWLKRRPA